MHSVPGGGGYASQVLHDAAPPTLSSASLTTLAAGACGGGSAPAAAGVTNSTKHSPSAISKRIGTSFNCDRDPRFEAMGVVLSIS